MKRIKRNIQILSVIIILFLFTSPSYSYSSVVTNEHLQDTVHTQNSPKQPVYTTSRLVTPEPVIDGKLDDECWKKGTWAGNFRQWIPKEGAKPTYQTDLNRQPA